VAYGTEALETWLQFEAEERATCHFAFGFKPDLVKSERARRDAWAFLLKAFSNRWRSKGDAMEDFKGHIFVADSKKWLKNAFVREFQERARAYRPSPIARTYFRGLDHPLGGLVLDTPLDLIDWVRRTLTRGGAVGALRGQFARVILTGGSCHWPFMAGLVAETLAVAETDVILSQTPETTIGSGLALYNVLKLKNDARRGRLRSDKLATAAQFRVVAKRLNRFADDAADALVRVLMPRVEAVFQEWYTCGGSLKHVEDRMEGIGKVFEQTREAETVLKPQEEALAADLVRLLRDHLKQFLALCRAASSTTLQVMLVVVIGICLTLGHRGTSPCCRAVFCL
jgi:hypothetical protein